MAPVGVCISLRACPVAPEVGDQFGWGVGAHSPLSRRPYSVRCGTACRWARAMTGRSDAWARPRAFLALCSVAGETAGPRPLPDVPRLCLLVCVALALRTCACALQPRTDPCAWAWALACIRRGAVCTGGGGGGAATAACMSLRGYECAGVSAMASAGRCVYDPLLGCAPFWA